MPPTRSYLDPHVLARIGRLDLRARRVVEGFITGPHRSPYHGFAVEFAQHRPYSPGDEIKHIDWKVWSKTDRLFIKEYEEETNLQCTIVLDCSKSMSYGGQEGRSGWSKFDYGATLGASLAYLLHRQQDAVGLVAFDRQVRLNLHPSAHPSHLKLLVHELEQTVPDHRTDVAAAFTQLADALRRRGLIVLISDLLVDLDTLTDALSRMRHRRHEVIVFHVMHEHELDFPFTDNILFRGLETDNELLTEPRALRRAYLESKDRFIDAVRRCCASAGIDYRLCSTADPLDAVLSSYLVFRQKTMRAVRRT